VGLESIVAFTLGTAVEHVQLPRDGELALPVPSALLFPVYRVQVRLPAHVFS
jgi:hypothetical protein